MGNGFSIFLILGLITAAIFLICGYVFPDTMNLQDNQIQILSSSALLAYFILALMSKKTSASVLIKQITIWLGIFLLVIIGYSFKSEINVVYEKVLSNLMPYKAQEKENTARFIKSSNGHFIIEIFCNGKPIKYLVDTGASRVVLNQYDAQALGIDVYNLNYNLQVSTANGIAWSATIRIKEMRLGGIIIENVLASVAKGELEQSLLGMSFLERLKSYSIEGDVLTLKN